MHTHAHKSQNPSYAITRFAHELLELLYGRLQRLCELSAFKPLPHARKHIQRTHARKRTRMT